MSNNFLINVPLKVIDWDHWPNFLKKEAKSDLNDILKSTTEIENSGPFAKTLLKVLPFSPFVKTNLIKYPDITLDLFKKDLLFNKITPLEIKTEIDELLTLRDEQEFIKAIRILRAKHMARIAIRDISGLASFEETCTDLSELAAIFIEYCLRWLEKDMEQKYGHPYSASGQKMRLIVLGMGKLGGRELNFSSDIDLIFSFREKGVTEGGNRKISVEEYFFEQARKLIKLLSFQTEDGIVFRVDTRLRPFGDSGPLVISMDAMEEYYERHGRQWERYAFVKARPIAGDLSGGFELLKRLKPFIYKKYLDYSNIEALKEMKGMIIAEQIKKASYNNVKLGPGGIRDIEFIVQTLQLIKGGRITALQTPSFFSALSVIEKLNLMDAQVCLFLKEAYIFLRTTENRLQEYQAAQLHTLPKDPDKQLRLALSIGFKSWDEFYSNFDTCSKKVNKIFEELFEEQKDNAKKDKVEFIAKFIWSNPKDEEAKNAIKDLGFKDVDAVSELLASLKESKKVHCLTGQAQEIIDEIIPNLILFSSREKEADKALKNSLFIIEAILKRTIYLLLLKQYPSVLNHLVFLCSKSSLIADLLRRQPILLDDLIDANLLFSKFSKQELKTRLQNIIDALSSDDLELWLDEIRRFKKGNILRVAACELKGILEAKEVGKELANLSEIIVEKCAERAWEDIQNKAPDILKQSEFNNSGLCIIGYGKLGSREMGYSSDLDLVFLYDTSFLQEATYKYRSALSYFYSRFVQKLIFFTTTRTSQGILYEIDTRLRPNGSQGILVSSIESFYEYQEKRAWTWEYQALIRARFISGDKRVGRKFESIRKELICKKRDETQLKRDVLDMRNKIIASIKKKEKDLFHLKKDRGGVIDIEFIAQYLVLKNAKKFQELSHYRGTVEILEHSKHLALLNTKDADFLKEAYLTYLKKINLLSLDLKSPMVSIKNDKEFSEIKGAVEQIFNNLFVK